MPRLSRLSLSFLPLLLAACGGDSAAPGDSDHVPLATGNRWSYQVTETGTGALPPFSRLHTITGSRDIYGTAAFQHYLAPSSGSTWITWNDRKAAGWLERVLDPAVYGTLQTLNHLRLPLRAGDAYDAYNLDHYPMGEDLDGDSVEETVSLRRSIVVSGPEVVTVPAGTFPDALKVTSQGYFEIHYSNSPAMTPVTSTVEEWYVAGVGVVKSRGPGPNARLGITEEARLKAYRINGASTDTTAPAVTGTSVQSGGGPVVGTWTTITITTSEPLDPRAVTAATYTLLAADGSPQSIQTVGAGEDGLAAITSTALAPGRYTLTMAGLTDFMGNPLPTWSGSFDAP